MTLRKLSAMLLALVLCVLLCSCGSSAPTPLLYKVTDANGNTTWLFGSIHVATDDMYPLPDYVLNAYEGSDALAVECDVIAFEEDEALLSSLMATMVYADGTTINEHLDKELYNDAVEILKDNDYYSEELDRFLPIMWATTIDNLSYAKWGYDGSTGIDRYLLQDAKANGKEICEVESVESQYAMLASFSPELQAFLLENSVTSHRNPLAKYGLVVLANAWKRGDEETLNTLLNAGAEDLPADEAAVYNEYTEALITTRNIHMADYAETALQSGDEVFICVGAAHVVGEGGIADLLTERGYTVEKVSE